MACPGYGSISPSSNGRRFCKVRSSKGAAGQFINFINVNELL
ncbi:hypothetical protein D3OALGB2SA_1057 [Olavius algarvensis associated proteobacterium Delta 3]|nr:hypothetical protein D3OALGB2SA_1057 [Olavius algarvensis associated proteobacterium Delta 3]